MSMIEDLKDLTYFDIFTDKMKNEFYIYCKRIIIQGFMNRALYDPHDTNTLAIFQIINKENPEHEAWVEFRTFPSDIFSGYDISPITLAEIIKTLMSILFYENHNIGECTQEEFEKKLHQHYENYNKIFHEYIDEKKWKELKNDTHSN
jgi:hypothetical protein